MSYAPDPLDAELSALRPRGVSSGLRARVADRLADPPAGRRWLWGVALGTAIPNVLFAGLVLWQACRELETPVAGYLRYVVPRATLGALPILALLLWFKLGLDVRNLGGLAGAGVAMVLLFGVTWVVFVYRNDPYVDLRGRLAALRATRS